MVNSTIMAMVQHDILIDRTKTEFTGLSLVVAFFICDIQTVRRVYYY